jgi:hypothetical protein
MSSAFLFTGCENYTTLLNGCVTYFNIDQRIFAS